MQVSSYEPGIPCWVDLGTTDPGAARDFYGQLFGWTFDISPDEKTGHYTLCLKENQPVAGVVGTPMTEQPPMWGMYFATEDVNVLAEKITADGGALVMGPFPVGDTGSMLVAQDPTGAFFGAWQGGTHIGATLVNEPSTLSWNELHTRELDAAIAFYTSVFGLGTDDISGEGFRYHVIKVGDRIVGGLGEMGHDVPHDVPPHWTAYFAVSDVDEVVANATSLGAAVVNPAHDTTYGRWAELRDPQGATFCVIVPAPQDQRAAEAAAQQST